MFKDRKTESAESQIFKVLAEDVGLTKLNEWTGPRTEPMHTLGKEFIDPSSKNWEKLTAKDHEDRANHHRNQANAHHNEAAQLDSEARIHAKKDDVAAHTAALIGATKYRIEAKKHELHAQLHDVHKGLKFGNKLRDIIL